MPDQLLYRDIPMRAEGRDPRNSSTLTVPHVRAMLEQGHHVHMYLEPGDATRYDLVFTPLRSGSRQTGLVVIRLIGGHFAAAADLWDWTTGASEFQIDTAAGWLSKGNEWSHALFKWWLTLLCTEN